jgi:ABC-type bacteriocin/lantibiotic exporter with double-glycine peptidase domain
MKKHFALLLFIIVLGFLSGLFIPLILVEIADATKIIIDMIYYNNGIIQYDLLYDKLFFLVILILLEPIINLLKDKISHYYFLNLKLKFYANLKNERYFALGNDLLVQKINYIDKMEGILVNDFKSLAVAIGNGLFSVIVIFHYSKVYFLSVIVMSILVMVVLYFYKNSQGVIIESYNGHLVKMILHLLEIVNGNTDIKFNNIKNIFLSRVFKDLRNIRRSKTAESRKKAENIFLMSCINTADLTVLFIIGIILIMRNNTSIGVIVAMFNLQGGFRYMLQNITKMVTNVLPLKMYFLSLFAFGENRVNNYIEEDLGTAPVIRIRADTIGHIKKNVNFDINRKDKILITGNNGSGKSLFIETVLNNLSNKKYLINRDKIVSNINEYLCNNISICKNNTDLYNLSIRENVLMGNEVNEKKLFDIIKLVQLNEFIGGLKNGSGEVVVSNGLNLSSGQRQRIVIARTLYKDADIYIFDESTSALDKENEEIIVKNVIEYLEEKIVLFVSHSVNIKKYFYKNVDFNYEVVNS